MISMKTCTRKNFFISTVTVGENYATMMPTKIARHSLMFQKLFDPDNGLKITLSQVSDCIFLSLFWTVGCFPVLTIGASTAALYDATVRAYRKGDKHSWQRFFKVYSSHLKAGVLPTAVFLALFALLVKAVVWAWNGAVLGSLSWMAFSAAAFIAMLGLGILSVMFPLLSRFETSFGTLMKNTVLLALANLPRTVVLGFVNTAAVLLCAKFVLPLFFLPALAALIGSLCLEPMSKPYMPKEETNEDAA